LTPIREHTAHSHVEEEEEEEEEGAGEGGSEEGVGVGEEEEEERLSLRATTPKVRAKEGRVKFLDHQSLNPKKNPKP